jgi:hypothetical protein
LHLPGHVKVLFDILVSLLKQVEGVGWVCIEGIRGCSQHVIEEAELIWWIADESTEVLYAEYSIVREQLNDVLKSRRHSLLQYRH